MTDVGKLRSCIRVSVVVFSRETLRGVSFTCSPAIFPIIYSRHFGRRMQHQGEYVAHTQEDLDGHCLRVRVITVP